MAKYECNLQGDFDDLLNILDEEILNGSMSASFEDGSDYICNDTRGAVRVYERYSMMGGNRVSLSITLIGNGNNLFISAITSGGSQAVFFKINTVGEETFIDCVRQIVENYTQSF